MTRLLLAALLVLGLLPAALAGELETDIIYSTRAHELQSVLADLAAPEGSVGVYRDQLIIRATPDKLELIRDTLEKIDRPLKNLRISVRRQQQQSQRSRETGVRGKIGWHDHELRGHVVLDAEDDRSQRRDSNTYSITALEGSTVFIATGTEIPVLSIASAGNGLVIGNQYVPVQSGLQVTPRLQADGHVLLSIHFQHAELAAGGSIASATTQTQIQARAGQWTPLSRVEQNQQRQGSSLSGQYRQQETSLAPLEILVEEMPD